MAKKKASEPSARRGRVNKSADDVPATFETGGAAAPKAFDAEAVANEMRVFWQSGRGDTYLVQGADGRWHAWTQQAIIDLMRSLPGRMIAIKPRENEMLSEAKRVLLWVRQHRALDDVLPALPGYACGIHELDAGELVLVKSNPRLVEPEQGEWPTIRGLVEALLGADKDRAAEIDQTQWFWSWCKVAYESLRNGQPGNWRQGHAMILAGPAGCGKNRIQEQLITGLLGGRYANPTKFLFAGDEFNGDVFAAEHLLLGEIPLPSQKTTDRVALAERIKQVVANAAQRMRLMRTEPATVFPYWRLTISVNDDQDTLSSLPIVTSGYGDKILIFHCRARPLPILCEEGDEDLKRARFRDAIKSEMPAFAWWLLNEFVIPEKLLERDGSGRDARRFGFREFHHPVIKGELFEDTPAAALLRLIDMAEFSSATMPDRKLWELQSHEAESGNVWWERSETLQQLLTGESDYTCSVHTMAKKLFAHNSCARLLGRLASDDVTAVRVEKGDTRHWKGWRIARPTE